VPVKFPPLLKLGGEEAFAAYRAEFDHLYRSGEVKDVWERRVLFDEERCEHVCFKDVPGSKHGEQHRVWSQERAERIRWVETALRTPDSIRPSHTAAGRQVYMVEGTLEVPSGTVWQWFMVYVEPEAARRAKKVDFITAFPPDTLQYWKDAGHQAPRLYPPSKHRGRKRF
jgi:hypothetical protein